MESSNSPSSSNKAIIGIIVIVLLVAAATAVIVMSANKDKSESTVSEATTSPSVSSSPESSTSSSAASSFKDGEYSATGNYQTPGGRESIGVTVTLANGMVTDASVKQNATGGEAAEYQEKFVSAFKSQVVGKKIDEVSLSRVAGSSLTPNGFNSAISDIENQAKA